MHHGYACVSPNYVKNSFAWLIIKKAMMILAKLNRWLMLLQCMFYEAGYGRGKFLIFLKRKKLYEIFILLICNDVIHSI